jgi:peptide/nickel transport system permease protein
MGARATFVLRRLLLTLPVLLVMSVLVFLVIHLIPGNPGQAILGLQGTPRAVAQINHELRLDESLPSQYLHWISGAVHGDLGQDFVSREPVRDEISSALPVTVELAVAALFFGVITGVTIGVLAARGPGWSRRISDAFAIAGAAIPDFWMGIMLVLLFAAELALLPPEGFERLAQDPAENIRYMILPVLTLGIGQAAYFSRSSRSAIEDAMKAPYVVLLRSKGLSDPAILWRHALRNASAPIVTVVGLQFGVLLGGAIVVETLFALPGLGQLLVSAVHHRNYTVVQGTVLVIATMFILVNLLTDLLIGFLDPRIADGAAG